MELKLNNLNNFEMKSRGMAMVAIALFPPAIVAVYVFGPGILLLTLVCAVSCMLAELAFQMVTKRPITLRDGSALITGVILSFGLPADLPLWMAMLGCMAAILIAKQLFGGYGNNFLNPAAAGLVFLQVSFSSEMNHFPFPNLAASITGQVPATPLQLWIEGRTAELPSYIEMFLGFVSGGIGQVSALALLIGAVFLWYKGVLSPITSLSYLGTVALVAFFARGGDPIFQLLAGGTIYTAVFLAGDRVTIPRTAGGRLIFGIGCGILTMMVRYSGTLIEGGAFAILSMNILTPYIDRIPPIPWRRIPIIAKNALGGRSGRRAGDESKTE
jgi:electron transport complex protein RnfD